LRVANSKQGAAMARGQASFFQEVLDWSFELQQANRIGNRGAIFPGSFCDLLLGKVELFRKALKRARLLDRIEILALEVLHKRHLERHLFRDVADNGWNASHPRSLSSTPPALAGDELIAVADTAHDEGLNNSACCDGTRELIKGRLAESGARLIGTGIDQVDVDLNEAVTMSLKGSRVLGL
jgi:hypothetical protein